MGRHWQRVRAGGGAPDATPDPIVSIYDVAVDLQTNYAYFTPNLLTTPLYPATVRLIDESFPDPPQWTTDEATLHAGQPFTIEYSTTSGNTYHIEVSYPPFPVHNSDAFQGTG